MKTQRPTLIRFVSEQKHKDTSERSGIFISAYELQDSLELSPSDRDLLENLLDWFTNHLKTPERFNRTKSKGYYRKRTSGVSWLKDSSQAHIAKMRELSDVLERYGHSISMIKTTNPGYIVYEDDYQVVSESFRDS